MDIALDWTTMSSFELVVGEDFGRDLPEENGTLSGLLANARPLVEQGDGYRSFAGVILAVLTFPNRVLLLDEPEAFLHPAQARFLGRWLAEQSLRRPAQVLVASHSADFLNGVVGGNPQASVVRLNRSAQVTQYHLVPPATTDALIHSPLLSSQPVMDALFHKGVVVCEGDPDRAVYQTIASNDLGEQSGDEILFIHSNGKDAAKGPISLLKNAGTPVCTILDFDLLNSADTLKNVWAALRSEPVPADIEAMRSAVAAAVEEKPEAERMADIRKAVGDWLAQDHLDLRRARKALELIAQTVRWDSVKQKGLDYFDSDTREIASALLDRLAGGGLFVVPKGELESWLGLEKAKGARWNRAALELLATTGAPNDLRQFVQSISNFLVPSAAP